MKIAVLMGGISSERDVSIESGNYVAAALKEAGFNVVTADIGPDNTPILEDGSIDVFFPALHGEFGEDGQLQQILENKSLVYTGSDSTASKLAIDKTASKKIFVEAGIDVPGAIEFSCDADIDQLKKQLQPLADKYVVKPIRQGSTIGVSIADDPKSTLTAAQQCLNQFGDCMIEQYIPGKEITVGILNNHVLPIIEIKSKTGFYDYHAKYIDDQTQYLFDTIEPTLGHKIQSDALVCFNALGLRHFARVDFILSNDQKPYVLEANTIPGMTTHSLLPKAAERAGISMSELCAKIVEAAYLQHVTCDS